MLSEEQLSKLLPFPLPQDESSQLPEFPLPAIPNLETKFRTIGTITINEFTKAFNLVKRNMLEYHELANDTWSDSSKINEMTEKSPQFILFFSNESLIALLYFQLDAEEGEDVVYVYELQVLEGNRGLGIGGTFLITQLLSWIGLRGLARN